MCFFCKSITAPFNQQSWQTCHHSSWQEQTEHAGSSTNASTDIGSNWAKVADESSLAAHVFMLGHN